MRTPQNIQRIGLIELAGLRSAAILGAWKRSRLAKRFASFRVCGNSTALAGGGSEKGSLTVDESGEDYVYPARLFQRLTFPAEVQRALRRAL